MSWAVAGVGRHQLPMAELAIRLGGHARVGLEDNVYVSKGVLAKGSFELVEHAAAAARAIGREIATPDVARRMLGLPSNTDGASTPPVVRHASLSLNTRTWSRSSM
jgi:3-keto-5-aminohexanoate cleavage enzyme